MASVIANIATSAAQTAHAHVAALLAARQVQPGDKLPLNETVKETDATKPIQLAPTGKNIFVRVASPSLPLLFSGHRPHSVLFHFCNQCRAAIEGRDFPRREICFHEHRIGGRGYRNRDKSEKVCQCRFGFFVLIVNR